jgi:predicted O-methyltransferase YrrM
MRITINKNEVLSNNLLDNNEWMQFAATMPKEHYALLCYITTRLDNATILDMGTWAGWSAISLAQNPTNKVITYDIVDELDRSQCGINVKDRFLSLTNIERKMLDARNETEENIKAASLIMLDVDPHDGIQEMDFTNYLSKIKYTGFVVCDDIYVNQGMIDWWNSITLPKYDLTNVGHYTGTGIICYGDTEVSLIELQ